MVITCHLNGTVRVNKGQGAPDESHNKARPAVTGSTPARKGIHTVRGIGGIPHKRILMAF